MTAWFIEFSGTIYPGTPFKNLGKPFEFSGSAITTENPLHHDSDPEGEIFKRVAEHFKIVPPFTISLRIWHPSNVPQHQIKKTWVMP